MCKANMIDYVIEKLNKSKSSIEDIFANVDINDAYPLYKLKSIHSELEEILMYIRLSKYRFYKYRAIYKNGDVKIIYFKTDWIMESFEFVGEFIDTLIREKTIEKSEDIEEISDLVEIDKYEYLSNTTVEEDMIFNKRFKEVEISSEVLKGLLKIVTEYREV